jgi:hypothetical protein
MTVLMTAVNALLLRVIPRREPCPPLEYFRELATRR